jgi:hypothetical protein
MANGLPKEKIYPFRKCIGLDQAFQIYTRHTPKPLDELVPPSDTKPFFVLLYGPPGCGKSYTFDHLQEILPDVNPKDAVYISLDALAESVGKFRNKSLEAYGKGNYNACGSIYTTTIRGTYNNSLYNKAPPKPKKTDPPREVFPSLVNLRIEALDVSISKGLNILYERTASSTKEDIFQDEFFSKIARRYRVFVIYPQVVSITELQARLAQRIHIMAKEKGFARFVEPAAAELFVKTHNDYMTAFLLPKLGIIIDALYLVYPSEGSYTKVTAEGSETGTIKTPLTTCEVPEESFDATGAKISGGKPKRKTRKTGRKRKSRHGR